MDAIQQILAQSLRRIRVGSNRMTSEKILIVDDTPANIQLLAGVLEPRGYEILTASNAEQALRIAARTQPDLILLDVVMPGTDGFAVCRELKDERSDARDSGALRDGEGRHREPAPRISLRRRGLHFEALSGRRGAGSRRDAPEDRPADA